MFEHALRIRVKSTPDDGKEAAKAQDTRPRGANADSLEGRLSNLISSDLNNITSSRDFFNLFLYSPIQIIGCICFLYVLLGSR